MLNIELGEGQRHESLTIYPLLDPETRELSVQLLGDALESGCLKMTEVGQGTVPELLVENGGDSDVLILDGEQLVGARQNRMTNRSLILAAHSKTRIPVSCMEHGRWHFESRLFRHAATYSPSKVRRHNRRHEAAYAEARQAATPKILAEAQADVWDEIADYSDKLGGRSPTGALDNLHELKSFDLEEWSSHFPWVDDQIGVLAFVDGEPLGMDLIGGHRLYGRLHKRLISGYVMDAFAASESAGGAATDRRSAQRFLGMAADATRTEAPTVGKGTYRVLSGDVVGGELRFESRLAHLSAFPAAEEPRGTERSADEPRVAPPSRRRRWIV